MSLPRKLILLHESNETDRAVHSYVFKVNGFDVHGGLSPWPPIPDLAFVVQDSTESVHFGRTISGMLPDLPMVVIVSDLAHLPEGYPSHAQFIASDAPMAMVVDRMKMLVGRKKRKVVEVVGVVA